MIEIEPGTLTVSDSSAKTTKSGRYWQEHRYGDSDDARWTRVEHTSRRRVAQRHGLVSGCCSRRVTLCREHIARACERRS
ncbi:hypothetical protein [Streptomyces sp. NPDC048710]|uniref:hypothetical protein n=1 Tax=unclassified Streptomyces TaxID=2593676 RepID=UPI0037164E70